MPEFSLANATRICFSENRGQLNIITVVGRGKVCAIKKAPRGCFFVLHTEINQQLQFLLPLRSLFFVSSSKSLSAFERFMAAVSATDRYCRLVKILLVIFRLGLITLVKRLFYNLFGISLLDIPIQANNKYQLFRPGFGRLIIKQ